MEFIEFYLLQRILKFHLHTPKSFDANFYFTKIDVSTVLCLINDTFNNLLDRRPSFHAEQFIFYINECGGTRQQIPLDTYYERTR